MQMKINNAQSQTHTIASQTNAAGAMPFKALTHVFTIVIELLINLPAMNAVWRERRELETMFDRHTKDIGQTPDSVRQEVKRSYFDIPDDRKRSYRCADTTCYSEPLV